MPVKKTTKKIVTKVTDNKNGISILRWFFKPDMSQGKKKWIARSFFFVIGLMLLTILFGTVSMMSEMAKGGMDVPSFFAVAKQLTLIVYSTMLINPIAYVAAFMIMFVFGMFLFMPRHYLDKQSFIAVFFTSILWATISASAGFMGMKLHIPQFAMMIIVMGIILSISSVVASIVCFARKLGTSRLLTLLMFPFSATFFEFTGYFLPVQGKENVIKIKYNWYKRFISFLLDTKKGQLSMAIVTLLVAAISPTPWELFIIAFFGSLYLLRGPEWMAKNLNRLTVISAGANIILILGVLYASMMMGK
jgi:hypothetical protein